MKRVLGLGAVCALASACGSGDSILGPDGELCSRGTIALEQQRAGELASDACLGTDLQWSQSDFYYESYSIRLEQGRTYLVSLRSQEFDTMVELIGPGGVRLTFADDIEHFGGFVDSDSELYFVAGQTGVYSLRVRGYDDAELGRYSLSVRGCGGQRLSDGQTVQGTLTTARCLLREWFASEEPGGVTYTEFYVVRFAAGEAKRILLSSSAFTPAFEIGGPGFDFFADAGAAIPPMGTSEVEANVTVEAAGDYLLIIGSREPQATGAYSLSISNLSAASSSLQPQLSRVPPAPTARPPSGRSDPYAAGIDSTSADAIHALAAHRVGSRRSGFISTAARFTGSGSSSERNCARFSRMLSTPGLGQSVPQRS